MMVSWVRIKEDAEALPTIDIPTVCRKKSCPLYKQCCFLSASYTAKPVKVMFIGEAAGAREEELGRPFVGASGALLKATATFLLESIGLSPAKVGLAFDNLVHTRLTDDRGKNRPPTVEEFKACQHVLKKNVLKLKPAVVVTLGDVPFSYLTQAQNPLHKEVGRVRQVSLFGHKCWLVPCWHPARVLRESDIPLVDFVNTLRLAILAPIVLKGFPRLQPPRKIVIIDSLNKVKKLVQKLKNAEYVAFDTETSSNARVFGNRLLTIQFSADGRTGYVVPIDHAESPFTGEEREKVKTLIRSLFSSCPNKGPTFIAHNSVFDMHVLRQAIKLRYIPSYLIDTMVQAYLIDENYSGMGYYGLKRLAYRYGYDYEAQHQKALQYRQEGKMSFLPLKELADYGGTDAVITWQLFKLQQRIASLQGKDFPKTVERLLRYFYYPLHTLFLEMETNGLPVNLDRVKKLIDKERSPILKYMQELRQKLYSLPTVKEANRLLVKNKVGSSNSVWQHTQPWMFDWTKPDHGRLLFFEVKKVKPKAVGKSGKPSLDKNVLKELAEEGHEEANIFLQRNQVLKMYTSFIKPTYEMLLKGLDTKDGFIRPSFLSTGTRTGRASARNPNCLIGSTRIIIDKYGSVQLSDVYRLDLTGEQVVIGGQKYVIKNIWEQKHQEVIVVRTLCGRQLVGSPNHRLLVLRGNSLLWLEMQRIQIGDELLCQLPGFFQIELNPPDVDGQPLTVTKAKELGRRFIETAELPTFLFRTPRHLLLAFFHGLVGREIREQDKIFVQIDAPNKVIHDLLNLAVCAGVKASALYYDEVNRGIFIYGVTHELTYQRCTVRSVLRQEKERILYDLEVDVKHAFLADGLISHNSQQIPKVKGDEQIKKVRRATRGMFEAPPGWCLVELDVKTSEVRGLAIVSRDPHLLNVFRNLDRLQEEYQKNPTPELEQKIKDADPHRVNAAVSYGIKPSEVTSEMRDGIKVVTFGTMYGMSIPSLARTLKKTEKEAEDVYNRLFGKLKKAKLWIDKMKAFAKAHLYVESPIGRRRHLYHYLLNSKRLWAHADRRAVNSPIQGFCSDLSFLGTFLFVFSYVIPNKKPWFVLNTVHDSALYMIPLTDILEFLNVCPTFYTKTLTQYVKDTFGISLPIPIAVDFKVGINLAEMQKTDLTRKRNLQIVRDVFREYRRLGHASKPDFEPWQNKDLYEPCIDFVKIIRAGRVKQVRR